MIIGLDIDTGEWRPLSTVAEGAVLTIKCIPVQSCKLIIVFFWGVE